MLRSRSDEEVLVEVQEGPEEGSEGSERRPGEEERCNGDRLSLPPHPSTSSNLSSRRTSTSSTSTSLPNKIGNTARSSSEEVARERELRSRGEGEAAEEETRQAWGVNYREAAIFLQEGQNNDKFIHHPRDRDALPAYLLVHSGWFNAIDLVTSLVILALGFVEDTKTDEVQVPLIVHTSVELCALLLLSIQLFLRTRWIGWRSVVTHRHGIKAVTLLVMIIEALVVMVRNTSHFRVTRALRVLFVIDTHFCRGVRRFLRQMFKSLPPILDMLGLLLFIMVIYSVLGFYLFGPSATKPGSPYFKSFFLSFISLFVLLTTANYPDVMMPSYSVTGYSFFFFFTYLMVCLYFVMNLLLAVVYDAFTDEEEKKFRKLFLHKRKASQHAFKLLVTKENNNGVCFEHFSGMIAFFAPSNTPMDNLLMFKLLNKSKTGTLTMEEFFGVYDAVDYKWKPNKAPKFYYEQCKKPFSMVAGAIYMLVKSKAFDYTIYMLIISNGVLLIIQTSLLEKTNEPQLIYTGAVSYAFISIYTLEMILKMIGFGFKKYFGSAWNWLDFIITLLGIVSLVLSHLDIPINYIMILRPLRLLRLFKVKKRFRDVFGTFIILLPRLNAALIILALVGYFFGVVGFEIFGNLVLQNCCKDTTVAPYYANEGNGTGIGYYYLNNFNTLPNAYVTLFELMVVNNWFIIMEAYASVTGTDWSRVFFMVYYLFTMVVVTIIVTFILEAFLFRIEYKKTMDKDDEIKKLSTNIALNREEVFFLDSIYEKGGKKGFKDFAIDNVDQTGIEFIGTKGRTKEELQKMMYKEKMLKWQEEAQAEEEERAREFGAAVLVSQQGSESVQVVGAGEGGEEITITRTLLDLPRTSLSA